MIERFEFQPESIEAICDSLAAGNVCVVQVEREPDPRTRLKELLRPRLESFEDPESGFPGTEPQTKFESPGVKGNWLFDPPVVIGLLCAEGDKYEGNFVSAFAMWKALTTRFSLEEISPLFAKDAVTIEVGAATSICPVFVKASRDGESRIYCNFAAPLAMNVVPSGMSRPAFDFCREFVLQDKNQSTFVIKPGECALVPNRLMLSGAMVTGKMGRVDQIWFKRAFNSDAEMGSFVL